MTVRTPKLSSRLTRERQMRLEQHKSRGRSYCPADSFSPAASFWPTHQTVCIRLRPPLRHGCRSGTFFWQPGKHLAEALENGS